MRFIGLDVHREFAQVAVLEDGQLRHMGRVPTTPEALRAFARTLDAADQVVLEATCNTYAIVRLLQEHGSRVVVSNPVKTRAIAGSSAEDAINVIGTSFEFRETEFSNTRSDAFDGDFTRGIIAKTTFRSIGGDAIDVSGSSIDIQDVRVFSVGDKGISAGEGSQVRVTRFEGDKVGIGVASKDRSEVSISNSLIRNFKNAGLAAYTKKREYGPASITAVNVILRDGSNPTLIQRGSWIQQDGKFLEGTDLDVKALYDAGILGK